MGVRPSNAGTFSSSQNFSQPSAAGAAPPWAALPGLPGEIHCRVDPLLRGNYRVGADLAEYVEEAGEPLHGVHLDGDLPATEPQHVAFSRAGHTLASGDADGTIRLWNTADPAHPHPFSQPHTANVGSVFSLAFSADGRLLASGDADGTIGLWNVTDPAAPHSLGQPLAGHIDKVYSVAFAKNGNTLASASNDETIRLWNLNVDYAVKRVCAIARNDLTPQQWQAYIPQRPFQPPCAH